MMSDFIQNIEDFIKRQLNCTLDYVIREVERKKNQKAIDVIRHFKIFSLQFAEVLRETEIDGFTIWTVKGTQADFFSSRNPKNWYFVCEERLQNIVPKYEEQAVKRENERKRQLIKELQQAQLKAIKLKIFQEILVNVEQEKESLQHKYLRKKCLYFISFNKFRNKMKIFEDYQNMLEQMMKFVEEQERLLRDTGKVNPWDLEYEIEQLFNTLKNSYEKEFLKNVSNNKHGVRKKFLKRKNQFEKTTSFFQEIFGLIRSINL